MPYLMSAEVIAVPSSYLSPAFSVYVHTVASLLGRPRSVARSGTTLAPAAPFSRLRVVRVRKTSEGTLPPPEVYRRAGSKSCCGLESRTVRVPPLWGVESPPELLASLSSGPQAAAPAARTRLTDTAAARRVARDGGRIRDDLSNDDLEWRDRLTKGETKVDRRQPRRRVVERAVAEATEKCGIRDARA